jgi:molybdopterin synthase catalytic subunit
MISIQEPDFDLAMEYQALRRQSSAGAIVTFCGLVRDLDNNENIAAIELEHYPEMTEKALQQIIDQAKARWDIQHARVIHRVGRLKANDQIVFVGVSSAHRRDAFSACEFIMDFLKTQAPIWKKQYSQQGEYWVDAKKSDGDAASRWEN